jgi:riboflavin synthase
LFTGIVQDVGTILERRQMGGDVRLRIGSRALDLTRAALGDSISVQGVCLTVMQLQPSEFSVDVSQETLSLTTIGTWTQGMQVNLEPALRVGDALGGHFVSGHIDGVAKVLSVHGDARSMRIEVAPPTALLPYIARKGSVALDGVSLTINAVSGDSFGVNLIPHTQAVTTLGTLKAGASVNLEIDPIARYIERWVQGSAPPGKG